MASPLLNQASQTGPSVQTPALPAPPQLHPLIEKMGLMEGAKAWDLAMRDWTATANQIIDKVFNAIKQNSGSSS